MKSLKTSAMTLVLGLCAAGGLCAAETAATPSGTATTNAEAKPEGVGARIQFAEPIYDFGRVNGGEPVKHTFVFTNTGDATLEVSSVHPSCGCTTAGEWTKTVEPGQTGNIPVQFNSGSYGGAVTKTVSVSSNDKNQPMVVLQLKGTIWKPVDVNPQYAVMQINSETVSNATSSVHIVNNTDQPMKLSKLECNNPMFRAEIKTVKEDKEYEVVVHTVPPLNSGNTQGQITMQSTVTNTPTIAFTAMAIIQPSIVVAPDRVVVPAGPLTDKFVTTVSVRSQVSAPLKLSEPELNAKGVEYEVKETEPGKAYNINFTFPAGFEFPAGGGMEFDIKSSNEQLPKVKIPISAAPARAALQPPNGVTISPRASQLVKTGGQ